MRNDGVPSWLVSTRSASFTRCRAPASIALCPIFTSTGSPPSVGKGEHGIGFEAGFVAIMEHLSAHRRPCRREGPVRIEIQNSRPKVLKSAISAFGEGPALRRRWRCGRRALNPTLMGAVLPGGANAEGRSLRRARAWRSFRARCRGWRRARGQGRAPQGSAGCSPARCAWATSSSVPLGHKLPHRVGRLRVGEVPLGAYDAVLQVARVGAGAEHGHVVIALECEDTRIGERAHSAGREGARVGGIADGVAVA